MHYISLLRSESVFVRQNDPAPTNQFKYSNLQIFLTFEKEDEMDAHFIFGLVLVGFFFWLCFIFRNENKKK
jgi:hypothetical protein